jgi:uncharacterized phage protein (TIGR02218 family)
MSYDSSERSRESGAPAECYRFAISSSTSGSLPAWMDSTDTFVQIANRAAASTSWTGIPVIKAAPVGRIIILSLATHEVNPGSTPTGPSNNHLTITDSQGNTWTKLREYTANMLAGGDVVTSSIWACVVTTALTTSDTLAVTFAIAIPCRAIESRQFTTSILQPSISIVGGVDRLDEDSDPGLLSISGLQSQQYLFVRACAIHGTPGGADINLYTPTAGFTEFVVPHNNSTLQSEAADRQIGARGEFKIVSATGSSTNPSVDPATSPDTASVFIALKLAAVPGSSGSTIYRWTSGDTIVNLDVPGDGPMNYIPEPIERSQAEYTNEDVSGTITVAVSRFNPVGQMYIAFNPPSPVSLAIYRQHLGDTQFVLAFVGKVVAATFDGADVQLSCAPLTAIFKRNVPRLMFQRECNWALYGPGCTVNKDLFKDNGTLVTVDGRNLSAAVFATHADGWYTGGWIELDDGTKRYITKHVGDTITLQAPFIGLVAGATIHAFAGCDRTETTCDTKFNNLVNHEGFQRLPTRNPFELGMQ